MSVGSRIKERREQLDLSRSELAARIGVTPSAIANYENEISSPKIELMYKLFNALECDANYLHQDDMNALVYESASTPEEFENIIRKYRDLDIHGKKMVDFTLNEEWERSIAENKNKVIPIIPNDNMNYVNAAHADDYSNAPDELKQQEEDIMDDENF